MRAVRPKIAAAPSPIAVRGLAIVKAFRAAVPYSTLCIPHRWNCCHSIIALPAGATPRPLISLGRAVCRTGCPAVIRPRTAAYHPTAPITPATIAFLNATRRIMVRPDRSRLAGTPVLAQAASALAARPEWGPSPGTDPARRGLGWESVLLGPAAPSGAAVLSGPGPASEN